MVTQYVPNILPQQQITDTRKDSPASDVKMSVWLMEQEQRRTLDSVLTSYLQDIKIDTLFLKTSFNKISIA